MQLDSHHRLQLDSVQLEAYHRLQVQRSSNSYSKTIFLNQQECHLDMDMLEQLQRMHHSKLHSCRVSFITSFDPHSPHSVRYLSYSSNGSLSVWLVQYLKQ